MSKNVHVTDAIKLEGFQAILEPGKFGYSLAAIVGDSIIDALETERQAVLKWAESKLKNPKRATLKPTPVSYTHLRAHETRHDLVCRLLLEKNKWSSIT